MKRKSNYTGLLAKPFPPISLLRGDDEGRRGELLKEKMRLLFQHYGIEVSAPNSWIQLCLALAEAHVPGFSARTTRPGPHDKWTPRWRQRLYGDVSNLTGRGESPETACQELVGERDYRNRFGRRGEPPKDKTLLRIFREEEKRRRLTEKYLGAIHAFGFTGSHMAVLESGEPSPLYVPSSKEAKK